MAAEDHPIDRPRLDLPRTFHDTLTALVRHWRALSILFAVFMLAPFLVFWVLLRDNPWYGLLPTETRIPYLAADFIVTTIFTAAVARVLVAGLRGEPATARRALALPLQRWIAVLAASLIASAPALLIDAADPTGGATYYVWLAGCIVTSFLASVFSAFLVFAIPAAAVEGLGPVDAIRRSLELTRGFRLVLIAAFFLVSMLSLGLQIGIDMLGMNAFLIFWGEAPEATREGVLNLVWGLQNMLVGTVYALWDAVLYLALRRAWIGLTHESEEEVFG